MVDVLLWEWEWACCGKPFAVGDRVEFGVVDADDGVRELCAPATVPAFVETHHEREPEFHLSGVVRSVAALSVAHRVSRVPRAAAAPGNARFSSPGADWAIEVRPSPYVLTFERLPATALLSPLSGVRRAVEDDDDEQPLPREADPADGEIRRHVEGYLVTIDEG